jgi:hypothetical protein
MKRMLLIVTASLGLAASAAGSLMTLTYTGSFGPTTTLGGVLLVGAEESEAPFSLQAVFDPTHNIFSEYLPPGFPVPPGAGLFAATSLSILIQGTPYVAILSPNLNVVLVNSFAGSNDYFGAGLYSPTTEMGMASYFDTATPPFSGPAPTPSVLSDFLANDSGFLLGYEIMFDGGVSLVINDLGSSPFTAELTGDLSAVPEPGNLLGLCGLISVAGFLRCRRNAAAPPLA